MRDVNVIWRFFIDGQQRWKWQQLSVDRSVVAESARGYKDYETCLANAQVQGHEYLPAKGRRVQARRHRF